MSNVPWIMTKMDIIHIYNSLKNKTHHNMKFNIVQNIGHVQVEL